MLAYEGEATSFSSIMDDYIAFLQRYDDEHDLDWVLLDNRYDDFHGATFAIPKSAYPSNESVSERILILSEYGLHSEYVYDRFSKALVRNSQYFPDILQRVFPNAVIDVSYFEDGILDKYSPTGYLETIRKFNPTRVICFLSKFFVLQKGLGKTTYENCLADLINYCKGSDIILNLVYAPTIVKSVANYSLADTVDDTFQKINDISLLNIKGYNILDFAEVILKFDTEYFSRFAFKYTEMRYLRINPYAMAYSKFLSGLLTRYLLRELFGVNREEVYVSFYCTHMTHSSYPSWLTDTKNHYMSEIFVPPGKKEDYRSKTGSYNGKSIDLFYNTGYIIAVGMHTTFDYRLWMCEQGSITCKYEADKQIEDIGLMPFIKYTNGMPGAKVKPPVYPNTGCPCLTISDDELSKYVIGTSIPITYYFTRDSSYSSITIRVSGKMHYTSDLWQSLSFGRFVGVDDYNINNLFVAGGTIPLSVQFWKYYMGQYVIGFMYDFSMKNIGLYASSNLAHPTKPNDGNISNFRVLSPSGDWRDIFNYQQKWKDYTFNNGRPVTFPDHGAPLQPHTDICSSSDTTVLHTSKKMQEFFYWKSVCKRESSYLLNPVSTVLYNKDNLLNASGSIPHTYTCNSLTMPEGLVEIDGKRYLSIPNGWKDRLWHYPWWYGGYYWNVTYRNEPNRGTTNPRGVTNNKEIVEWYHKKNLQPRQQYQILDKLVINFDEVSMTSDSDLIVPYPDDWFDRYTGKYEILKMQIKVTSDKPRIIFFLYGDNPYLYIDYGDGHIQKYNYDSTVYGNSHVYDSAGEYEVVIGIREDCNYENILIPSIAYVKRDHFDALHLDRLVDAYSEIETTHSDTLLNLYINPNFVDALCMRTIEYTVQGHTSDYTFNGLQINNQRSMRGVLHIPYGLYKEQCNFINCNGTSLNTIYVYGKCDSVCILGGTTEKLSIYCSASVTNVFLPYCSQTSVDIYMYCSSIYAIWALVFYPDSIRYSPLEFKYILDFSFMPNVKYHFSALLQERVESLVSGLPVVYDI